jgi:mono/diheme cytochrome c family protein
MFMNRAGLPLCTLVVIMAPATGNAADRPVAFNRDIRPIFSDVCFQCHGPDKAKRKAGFRLDTEEGAFAGLRKGGRAIVPGDLAKSELYRRITAKGDERMPPAKSGHILTTEQIELIRRWIEQGAKWQKHWSLIKPERPMLPTVKTRDWPRSPIDTFVLARLEAAGLEPTPEADRATLIRRVTLDLTGLPPTPAEVDAFLADRSPRAYEKVVDRLLQSPRFGERMAAPWLDAARYADTNGYQNDGDRTMWRWRNWVIEAYNRNMPFDQFTIEQLAGDMLPNATLEQKIATGFNRNHRGNAEGGIIPEEYAVEYVVDRVDTTATVWLGLTMACARCHDHKYDPIKQKEFYQVFAYFNNVPEKGKAVKYGNSPPMIQAPTRQQQRQLAELEQRLTVADRAYHKLQPDLDAAQAAWEKQIPRGKPVQWFPSRQLAAHLELDGDTRDRTGHSKTGKFVDGEAEYVPGRTGRAAAFGGRSYLVAGDAANFGFYDKFSIAAWIYPKGAKGGGIVSRMNDTAMAEGYSLHLEKGKLHVALSKRWLDDAIRVETEESLVADRWYHVAMTYDGSRWASGVKVYVDGRPMKLKVNLDELNQSFDSPEPLRVGSRGTSDRFLGAIHDVRIYRRALLADEVQMLATPETITEIVALRPAQRSVAEAKKLRAYYLQSDAPERLQRAHQAVVKLSDERERLIESFPTTMVMEEMRTPRDTFVLTRGQYDKHGEKVKPGVPSSLLTPGANTPGSPGIPNDRLGFARWLVDPSNPLTARVAVNRFWQMYFGAGLVKSVADFGSQGDWPSHPELLDWLATEIMRTGWDVKAMQKTIVMSATYRQSAKVTPALLRRDPDNRLLARGPRFRLSAEMIRDQALAVSGLLVEKLGGPSVKPYQPPGLVKELTGTEDYVQDHGENLYRRSLYTYWKRTVAPPTMMTFDAGGRETCVVRETRTNTPLQALTLMNDVTFVEAARVLAQRIMLEGGATPEERITLAFRLATARKPRPAELKILLGGFDEHLAKYRKDRKAATKLVSAGEYPRNPKLDVSELAAYTAVAGLILNLDEVITKE